MKLLTGRHAGNYKEATELAAKHAGISGLNPEIVSILRHHIDNSDMSHEADKIIGGIVRNGYGSGVVWRADHWLIPLPKLSYESKDDPRLTIEIATQIVAMGSAQISENRWFFTLVTSIGKSQTISVPIILLQAVLEADLERFAIVARDSIYTTWEIPGTKPIRLANVFVNELTNRLQRQSVISWLGDFGTQGSYLAPLIAGSLFGLAFKDSAGPVPFGQEIVTNEKLLAVLEGMAFTPIEATEKLRLASSRLRSDMTLEEAIRITLQM